MPKTEINKLQMYYVRKDFWEKVKRKVGYFFVIMGLLFIISAFLNSIVSFILMIILIVCAVLTTIYSYIYFIKIGGKEND